jgi:hypothetical protein
MISRVGGEASGDLGVQDPHEIAERSHAPVVGRRESPADVEQLQRVPPRGGLLHQGGRRGQRLDEVLEIRALAAGVEAEPLDGQPRVERGRDQVHRLPRRRAELARQLDHRADVRDPDPQGQPRVRGVPANLPDLLLMEATSKLAPIR